MWIPDRGLPVAPDEWSPGVELEGSTDGSESQTVDSADRCSAAGWKHIARLLHGVQQGSVLQVSCCIPNSFRFSRC
jgi:hypothetical protein